MPDSREMNREIDYATLAELALEARKRSYAPYSRFCVGAALLTESGRIYQGCNVENAAYTPTNCAERTAVFKAVSEGERRFRAIAVAGGEKGAETLAEVSPCGVCRQVLAEFCDAETFEVILARSPKDYRVLTLGELFPLGFGAQNLQG